MLLQLTNFFHRAAWKSFDKEITWAVSVKYTKLTCRSKKIGEWKINSFKNWCHKNLSTIFGSKNFWVNKFLDKNFFRSKILFWVKFFFWSTNFFRQKFWLGNFGSRKFLGQKTFLVKITFLIKKKPFWSKKNFLCQKRFWVKNIFG